MSRKVWIALPAYSGTIHVETVASLMPEIVALNARGDLVELHGELGSPYICDARAIMVEKFLESDADTFVFIDHDISWPAGALVNLIDMPVDLRCGAYPYRSDKMKAEPFPVLWDKSQSELWADPETGMLSVWGAPTGFMVCSRAMLVRMVEAYSVELEVTCKDVKRGRYCALFAERWLRGHDASDGHELPAKIQDDYAFCRRWRDLGGQVWLQPEINFGHTGQKTFTGSVGAWLRARMELANA
jgi:hypothetical protein